MKIPYRLLQSDLRKASQFLLGLSLSDEESIFLFQNQTKYSLIYNNKKTSSMFVNQSEQSHNSELSEKFIPKCCLLFHLPGSLPN